VNDRLYRSRDERIIGGVCGGLAERFDLDPSLVRIGWALLTIVSGGIFLVIYAVMLFVVPEPPEGGVPRVIAPPGPGSVPGWQPPTANDGPVIPTGASASSEEAGLTGDMGAGTGSAGPSTPTAEPVAWGAASVPPPATAGPAGRNDGSAGLIVGVLLILGGGFLLLQQFVPEFDLDRFWPVAIIAVGVILLVLAIRPGRRA
jgi:phage shock protein PspC (stress-responsive transcriptional regulator)